MRKDSNSTEHKVWSEAHQYHAEETKQRVIQNIFDVLAPEGQPYIDSWTKEAFEETGGWEYISLSELAALGQIHRSAKWCDIFEAITDIPIRSKADLVKLFQSASVGEINLRVILKHPNLGEYTTRTSQVAFS